MGDKIVHDCAFCIMSQQCNCDVIIIIDLLSSCVSGTSLRAIHLHVHVSQ